MTEPATLRQADPIAVGDPVIASLEIDLDEQLNFRPGLIQLTAREIRAGETSWPLSATLTLTHADHGGIGMLELCDDRRLLARWRYTLARNPAALRFEREFNRLRDGLRSGSAPAPAVAATCPI
ncbi:MAG: hypothetical protein ACK4Q4_07950, partial [Rhodocyclaceae bacterium]